jgi:hypothetical protein
VVDLIAYFETQVNQRYFLSRLNIFSNFNEFRLLQYFLNRVVDSRVYLEVLQFQTEFDGVDIVVVETVVHKQVCI